MKSSADAAPVRLLPSTNAWFCTSVQERRRFGLDVRVEVFSADGLLRPRDRRLERAAIAEAGRTSELLALEPVQLEDLHHRQVAGRVAASDPPAGTNLRLVVMYVSQQHGQPEGPVRAELAVTPEVGREEATKSCSSPLAAEAEEDRDDDDQDAHSPPRDGSLAANPKENYTCSR